MRFMVGVLLTVLLYCQVCLADVPVDLYVSTAGTDSGNSCTDSGAPCRTIKNALGTVVHDGAVIHIARGTYDESQLLIRPDTQIVLEGGWNSTFSRQTCEPAGTIILAGHNTGYDDSFLKIYNDQLGEDSILELRCLTLQPPDTGAFHKVVSIFVSNGAVAHFIMNHVEVTGFTQKSEVILSASADAQLTASIKDSLFTNNINNENVFKLYSADGATLTLDMENVRITGNHTIPPYRGAIFGESRGNSNMTITGTNSIIAMNTSGIYLTSSDTASSSITLTNCTVAQNVRYELKIWTLGASDYSASLTNSILWDDDTYRIDIQLEQSDSSSLSLNAKYCILGEHESEGVVSYDSISEIAGEPLLDATWHLQKGSPAIDSGLCGTWFDDFQGHRFYLRVAPSYDIDGDPRPGFGEFLGCDIGADEYRLFSWPMFLPAVIGSH